jgi:hypothetical protein
MTSTDKAELKEAFRILSKFTRHFCMSVSAFCSLADIGVIEHTPMSVVWAKPESKFTYWVNRYELNSAGMPRDKEARIRSLFGIS